MKESVYKNKALYIVFGIHVLCTFLWQKLVFRNVGVNPSGTVAINTGISDAAERAVTYALTELFAVIFIFLLWRLIFKLATNFQKKYLIYLVFYLLGAFCILLSWPECLIGLYGTDDNIVTFAYGVRLIPDYWHSAYSSIIYAAAMLVLPISFSVTLIQWTFAFCTFSYVFIKSGEHFGRRKYLLFTVFLFPDALNIASNGHRIFQYVIAVVLFYSIIAFDIYEKRKRPPHQVLMLTLFAAFLSVWRSEGIILGAIGLVVYLIFLYGRRLLKTCVFLAAFFVFWILISLPQRMGSYKYYGKDYSIMNSFTSLQSIFNDPNANMSFDGAEQCLSDIDSVVPVLAVRQLGAEGFRRYNFNYNHHTDINQTGATEAQSTAYTKAFLKFVLHNPGTHLRTQLAKLFGSVKINGLFSIYGYDGSEGYMELPEWEYGGWAEGTGDLFSDRLVLKWANADLRYRIGRKVWKIREEYVGFLTDTRIYPVAVALTVVAGLIVLIVGIIRRESFRTYIGLLCGGALLNFAAVIAAMPDTHSIYLVTSEYLLLLLLFFFFGKQKAK